MTKSQAISEVFVTAFQALSKQERLSVLERLFVSKELEDDVSDIILAWQRRKEKAIPYERVHNEIKKVCRA